MRIVTASSMPLIALRRTRRATASWSSGRSSARRWLPVWKASEELLTFYRFPARQHKSLRTTNANREAPGRVPTTNQDAGFIVLGESSFAAVLRLLFGLFASGQVKMRRIEGWPTWPATRRRQRR